MTLWNCSRCGEEQIAFATLPEDHLCHACHEAQAALSRFTEADAGIPERYRRLTRESWSVCFQRPWPATVEAWTGVPHWLAIWGPTGTGKTGLATVLLAEHLRTGKRGERAVLGALYRCASATRWGRGRPRGDRELARGSLRSMGRGDVELARVVGWGVVRSRPDAA
jgi:hypothetical protein